jgi:general secretion pathway protein D
LQRNTPVVPLILFASFVILSVQPSSLLAATAGDIPVFRIQPTGAIEQAQATSATLPADQRGPQSQPPSSGEPIPSARPVPSSATVPRATVPVLNGQDAGLVQMQFDNIELRDLIRFVSNIMGKNFIYDESVVKGRVTVLSPRSLTREEVFRVFQSVLSYYGFTIMTTPEAYKIVRAADAKGMAVETLDKGSFMDSSPEEKITTLVYPLEYLDSNTMVGILRPLMSKDAYLASVPSANALLMIDTASNLQRLRTLITQVDLPVSRQLSGIEVYNVQHTNAADLAKALQALLAEGKKAQTPKDKIFVTSYTATNSLLISAPPEDMREIRRIVEEIDTFRPQVLVEAAIVELTLNKTQTLGVEWLTGGSVGGTKIVGGNITSVDPTAGGALVPLAAGLASAGTAGGTALGAATALSALKSGLNIGVFGQAITFQGITFPSVQAFIQALAADSQANVLSTPQLLTMNNEEAEILVGSNIPYTTSVRLDASGNPITNFDYRDVGVKLKVKPYINKDGLVYLNIFTEVTTVRSNLAVVGSAAQTAPTTDKRSTKTTVGVRDSQTIVISGIIQDASQNNEQGIPYLRSIPIIGKLFGYTNKSSNKTNLLVFLTPRIVYDSESLQKISDQMKSQQQQLLAPQGKK